VPTPQADPQQHWHEVTQWTLSHVGAPWSHSEQWTFYTLTAKALRESGDTAVADTYLLDALASRVLRPLAARAAVQGRSFSDQAPWLRRVLAAAGKLDAEMTAARACLESTWDDAIARNEAVAASLRHEAAHAFGHETAAPLLGDRRRVREAFRVNTSTHPVTNNGELLARQRTLKTLNKFVQLRLPRTLKNEVEAWRTALRSSYASWGP
jgi:hypothetical protein